MWSYEILPEKNKMRVYDHTGTLINTIENNSRGFRLPNDVLNVMMHEAMAEYQQNGFSPRAFAILRDAIFEQIEQVE